MLKSIFDLGLLNVKYPFEIYCATDVIIIETHLKKENNIYIFCWTKNDTKGSLVQDMHVRRYTTLFKYLPIKRKHLRTLLRYLHRQGNLFDSLPRQIVSMYRKTWEDSERGRLLHRHWQHIQSQKSKKALLYRINLGNVLNFTPE